MRLFFLSGLFFGLFYLGVIATVDAAPYQRYGSDACGSGCAGPCAGGCDSDCGYPYRGPNARSCDPCGDSCRPMTCHDKTYCGPLTPIFALFTRDSWCGSGCGERYWGDFYGNPPDCCDPCDRCGNYTGGSNGWSGGGGRGCNCNGGGQAVMEQMAPMEGRVIPRNDRVLGQVPTPAKSRTKITRQ